MIEKSEIALTEKPSVPAGKRKLGAVHWAVIANLLVTLIRPQNDIPILATINFPLILSFVPFLLSLGSIGGRWSLQQKLMLCILLQGAAIGPFALNNNWAFQGWRVLAQLFVFVLFPLALTFRSGRQLEALFKLLRITTLYLTFYGLTHEGRGPGDYLGDENDYCLVMVMQLGAMLGYATFPQSVISKMFTLTACGGAFAGIIVSGSRGGFLGMCAVFLLHLVYSPNRLRLISLAAVLGLFALALTPSKYWEDIRTITDSESGSALERRETWAFAWDIFTRRNVILFGVGMKNTPYHLGDYKTSENRNLWGRQTHSFYMELLPDLGILGTLLVGGIVWRSFMGNLYLLRKVRKRSRDKMEVKDGGRELRSMRAILLALNGAWAGVMISAAFISILYYPPIWLLAAWTAAAQAYCNRFLLTQSRLPMPKAFLT